jgi:hypothetical protein
MVIFVRQRRWLEGSCLSYIYTTDDNYIENNRLPILTKGKSEFIETSMAGYCDGESAVSFNKGILTGSKGVLETIDKD